MVTPAGGRRHQIEVQARGTAQDEIGGETVVWTTIFSTQAAITPLSGRELLAAQAVRAEVSHQFDVLYRDEWSDPIRAAGYRIMFKGRIFNIKSVLNVEERNRNIQILAAEGLNNG